jgi:hypothetical protein
VSVPVCTGVYQSGFKYFEFEFEKLKNETKIPETTSRFIESNIVKFPNLVHLVFFFIITTLAKIEKEHRPIKAHLAQG